MSSLPPSVVCDSTTALTPWAGVADAKGGDVAADRAATVAVVSRNTMLTLGHVVTHLVRITEYRSGAAVWCHALVSCPGQENFAAIIESSRSGAKVSSGAGCPALSLIE